MYGGTSQVERILGIGRGKISIGTTEDSTIGTSYIRQAIEQTDKYINARLLPFFDDLPISPTPDALEFCSNFLTAYFVYTELLCADSQEPPDAVKDWKDMALEALDSYIKARLSTRGYPVYTKQDRLFKVKGIKGIGEGIIKDEDTITER